MKITTDMIVGTGLVVALILNIALGGDMQITMNLSTGLVGWLGKNIFPQFTKPQEPARPQEPAKKEEPRNETSHA